MAPTNVDYTFVGLGSPDVGLRVRVMEDLCLVGG